VKEYPTLFSSPMVKAIIAGQKTQTRRVLKQQPTPETNVVEWNTAERAFVPWRWMSGVGSGAGGRRTGSPFPCPYGATGDRLWVRETWRTAKDLDDLSPSQMAKKAKEAGWHTPWAPLRYESDGTEVNWATAWGPPGKTRVSIHMPRWASRLALEVTEVRVQRLQEISEEDARAEGVGEVPFCKAGRPDGLEHVEAFENLWQRINGKRPGCSWEANPWVWAITFKRVTPA